MTRLGRIAGLAGAVGAWLGHAAEPAAETAPEIIQPPPAVVRLSPDVEVVAGSASEAARLARLAEPLPAVWARWTGRPWRPGQRLIVRVAAEPAEGSGLGRIFVEGGGLVSVQFGAGVPEPVAALGLAQAWLNRWTVEEAADAGTVAGQRIPPWLEQALALELQAGEGPAWAEWQAQILRRSGVPSLADVLTVSRASAGDDRLAAAAFWLVRILSTEAEGGPRLEAWLAGAVRGEDARIGLLRCFGGLPGWGEAPERSWRLRAWERIRRVGPGLRPADLDRERWSIVAQRRTWRDGRAEGWTADRWWEARAEAEVVADATTRGEVCRAALLEAHPFYFNAWLDLGRAMEALVAGREDDFRRAWASAAAEAELGDGWQAQAEAALLRVETNPAREGDRP